jgi:hypothetical protein
MIIYPWIFCYLTIFSLTYPKPISNRFKAGNVFDISMVDQATQHIAGMIDGKIRRFGGLGDDQDAVPLGIDAPSGRVGIPPLDPII